MRLLLFVEGDTETKALVPFVKKWLDDCIEPPVGLNAVRFSGCHEYRRECAKKAKMHLHAGGASDLIGIVGLIDLYRSPFDQDVQDPRRHVNRIKQHFENEVGDPRFRQFVAVWETEAWLLSDPTVFPRPVQGALSSISNPEEVNHGRPPSRVLKDAYVSHMRRGYKKVVDGYALFSKLDPHRAAEACPALKEMLEGMRSMAMERL